MTLLEKFRDRARRSPQRLVFPEGTDPRIVKAAVQIQQSGIAEPVLLGKAAEIREIGARQGCDVSAVRVVDPQTSGDLERLAQGYFERRRHKGVTSGEALQYVSDPVAYGAMMVADGQCDGYVAGAVRTTGDTVRAGIRCVGLRSGISIVSSFFIMVMPDERWGAKGALFYADCAVVPDPKPSELADIAVSTADNARIYLETTPNVALLSFSTRGSADHPMVDKVKETVAILREKEREFVLDGELQADAALIESVASRKSPDSPLRGRANTLIFPNLDAGNICYKITQRLAGAEAIGPILQGLAKPLNDLSRGCSVEDIVNVAAITALQAVEGKRSHVEH